MQTPLQYCLVASPLQAAGDGGQQRYQGTFQDTGAQDPASNCALKAQLFAGQLTALVAIRQALGGTRALLALAGVGLAALHPSETMLGHLAHATASGGMAQRDRQEATPERTWP